LHQEHSMLPTSSRLESLSSSRLESLSSSRLESLSNTHKQNREDRKVHDEWNVGSVYAHLGESAIKFQTKYIGAVESITILFFLEGVRYIKRTSHVSISVSTRMTLER